MLPPPMTAPVTAILATLTDDEVGLRCRPLIWRCIPLVNAPARSAVGFGLERSPGRRRLWGRRSRLHPKESRAIPGPYSVDRWVPRLHPWFSLVPPLLGWS